MDMKTFNGIFCINYGCDNVLGFFRRLIYQKFDQDDDINAINADKKGIFSTFDKLKSNNITLSIIIKSIEEQKEFYCLATILDFILSMFDQLLTVILFKSLFKGVLGCNKLTFLTE